MNRRLIEKTLQSYIPVDKGVLDLFLSHLVPVEAKNRDFLVRLNEKKDALYLLNKGCLMTYYLDAEGNKQVLQFAMPMWWTGDLEAFFHHTGSVYEIQAMEDSLALELSKGGFDSLLGEAPVFERYFRIIFQNSLVTHQRRILQNFSLTAEKRYIRFLDQYPTLEQHVPQKYIASYLGITPEFLSKIRRKRMDR